MVSTCGSSRRSSSCLSCSRCIALAPGIAAHISHHCTFTIIMCREQQVSFSGSGINMARRLRWVDLLDKRAPPCNAHCARLFRAAACARALRLACSCVLRLSTGTCHSCTNQPERSASQSACHMYVCVSTSYVSVRLVALAAVMAMPVSRPACLAGCAKPYALICFSPLPDQSMRQTLVPAGAVSIMSMFLDPQWSGL